MQVYVQWICRLFDSSCIVCKVYAILDYMGFEIAQKISNSEHLKMKLQAFVKEYTHNGLKQHTFIVLHFCRRMEMLEMFLL